MSDLVASLIRTAVPGLVGLVVGWFATIGVILPAQAKDSLALIVAFVAAFLWYLLVRLLEQKWPALGVLLGVPKQPVYSTGAGTVDDPAVITTLPAPAVAIDATAPAAVPDILPPSDVVDPNAGPEHAA